MSLIAVGKDHARVGMRGLQKSADLASQRNQVNENLKQQEKQSRMQGAGAGAAAGSMYGPWGALAGAAIGYLLA